VGDHVTVTNPEFITRVGYPMSYEDAYNHIEKNHLADIDNFVDSKILKLSKVRSDIFFSERVPKTLDKSTQKIISALACIYLDANGHGGKERSIHVESKPDMQGKTFEVLSKKVVKTGTYYPPWSQQDYNGEWDGGPGGLDNCKTRIVLELQDYTMHWNFKNKWDGCWIESCNVRLNNVRI
jgi:hypothetical protein